MYMHGQYLQQLDSPGDKINLVNVTYFGSAVKVQQYIPKIRNSGIVLMCKVICLLGVLSNAHAQLSKLLKLYKSCT